jgi:hypothetical protein
MEIAGCGLGNAPAGRQGIQIVNKDCGVLA